MLGGKRATILRIEALDRAVERIVASTPPTQRDRDRETLQDLLLRLTTKLTAGGLETLQLVVPPDAAARRDELAARAKALSDDVDAIQACLDKQPEKKPDTPPRGGEAAGRLRQVDVKEEPGPSSVGSWEFDEVGHRVTKWDALPGSAVQFTTPFSLDLNPKGDSVKLTVRVVPNIDRQMLTGAIEARAVVNGKAGANTVTVIASGSGKVESKILPVKIADLRVGDTVVIVLILTVGDTGKKPLRTSAKVTYTYAAK
jgi:hypothetical protein